MSGGAFQPDGPLYDGIALSNSYFMANEVLKGHLSIHPKLFFPLGEHLYYMERFQSSNSFYLGEKLVEAELSPFSQSRP